MKLCRISGENTKMTTLFSDILESLECQFRTLFPNKIFIASEQNKGLPDLSFSTHGN